jgi:general secretion pathway protein D/MSHA biogenesis protein MshL
MNLRRLMSVYVILMFLISGCASHHQDMADSNSVSSSGKDVETQSPANNKLAKSTEQHLLINDKTPVTWRPSYVMVPDEPLRIRETSMPPMKVGARIKTRKAKVTVGNFMKSYAALKGLNVVWGYDVDQQKELDVDISPKDDYWDALDNTLKQVDLFYEVDGNRIVVKYKDTRKFYIANPFMTGNYRTEIGGDFLGSSLSASETATQVTEPITGIVKVGSTGEKYNLWETIESNLQKILDMAEIARSAQVEEVAAGNNVNNGENNEQGDNTQSQETLPN